MAIVTPNHMHAPLAKAFLKAGINVICDKPLTTTVEGGEGTRRAGQEDRPRLRRHPQLHRLSDGAAGARHGRRRRARRHPRRPGRICAGLADREGSRRPANKQAKWRTDPKQSGAGGSIGDIGTHAYNLACFVTGLKLDSLCADLTAFVKGRKLDDNDNILLRWKGGAKGMLWASQVAVGHENGAMLRVYGSKGGLVWRQEDPNYLWFSAFGKPPQLITRAGAGAGPEAGRVTRVPAGHPEGYLEGFANIYTEAARAIRAHRAGKKPDPDGDLPDGRGRAGRHAVHRGGGEVLARRARSG